MRLRHCRILHPCLPRLFHNEPLLLRRPELTDPSSSNNRLSRFHRVPRTHGIKPCLQRACRKKNALSRRPTVDAYGKQADWSVEADAGNNCARSPEMNIVMYQEGAFTDRDFSGNPAA